MAMQEITRRYLQAYGPARPENFQLWWGHYIGPARQAFNSIAGETEDVDVEGWQAKALRSTIEPILGMQPTGEVHLLPIFDAYTIGLTRGKVFQQLASTAVQKKVYRPQGWISAVVLADGVIIGTWEQETHTSMITIKVSVFATNDQDIREKIAAKADLLGEFLNNPVMLEFMPQ